MTKQQFLKENREAITEATGATNDVERWQWVMNDESLYNWARSCGVRV